MLGIAGEGDAHEPRDGIVTGLCLYYVTGVARREFPEEEIRVTGCARYSILSAA
jgi:hypothetical protein